MQEELVENYKIKVGKEYQIIRDEHGGRVYYKIHIRKKTANGEILEGNKTVRFASDTLDTNIIDGAIVIPKKLFEDFYYTSSDKYHYNPVWYVVITDWDLKVNVEKERRDAINNFTADLSEYDNIDLPF